MQLPHLPHPKSTSGPKLSYVGDTKVHRRSGGFRVRQLPPELLVENKALDSLGTPL